MAERNYAQEIADATADGNVKALAALAIALAGEVAALEKVAAVTLRRRKADADRKRSEKDEAPESPHTPQTSEEIGGTPQTAVEVAGTETQPPSPPSPSSSFPTPHITLSPSPTPPQQQLPPRAREDWRHALGVTGQPLREAMDELTAKLGGGENVDRTVEEFIGHAPAASRFAWTRSLISALDPLGGQRVAPDVLLLAMQEFLIADRTEWPWVARVFRGFVDDVARPKRERLTRPGAVADSEDTLTRWARDADARDQQHDKAPTHA
jgi:hypothetical protein